MAALCIVVAFCLVAIYAPFLASSKPLFVNYDGTWYFPLFRYLLYSGFYTKRLDIFFNLLIFTFPLFLISFLFLSEKMRKMAICGLCIIQAALFLYFAFFEEKDPASDPALTKQAVTLLLKTGFLDWNTQLKYMSPYAKLNLLLQHQQRQEQQERLQPYQQAYEEATGKPMPTLWQIDKNHEAERIKALHTALDQSDPHSKEYQHAQRDLQYIEDRNRWIEQQAEKIHFEVNPLISDFHWEDDAGGSQSLNQYVSWWELTRTNRKDLLAALIFGVRISVVVGLMSVGLSLFIGIPIGAFAGYYGGTSDIVVSRLLEIWESMPIFFMLLLVVAITQSKSIFIVIAVIGIFGWTGFSRYIRGEFFKQRNLSYVEACHSLGFKDGYIMFSHILPNAIPPLLTLLPFAVMGAITSEAGLSFLGLGEEGSCSWGVLMDEGRSAFPGESYLLWPPAILLTILLVSIALVGDALRDALDPKMHRQ